MTLFCSAAILCIALLSSVACDYVAFPENFILGVASSNYQTEGSWNVSDKSESIYDRWTHTRPQDIADYSNADITSDSYRKYEEDVQLIKNIGFDAYRLSISWARLLPNGFANNISADGLAFYKNFLQKLVDNGIKPIVTLHHMDHPQNLEDMGGWTNELMVKWFADYVRVVFQELGHLVHTFITINQPAILCQIAYQDFPPYVLAPAKKLGNYGQYLCMHNVLKAHARAYHMYDEEFRPEQKGKIGMVASCYSYQPLNASNAEDYEAAEIGFQFNCAWIWQPILLGDYPEIMKTRVAEVSKIEGYESSRMPEFTTEEIHYINGTSDFCGFNYYYVWTARFQTDEEFAENPADSGIVQAQVTDLETVADGLDSLLARFRRSYGNVPIIITENGYSNTRNITDDTERISYFHVMLTHLLTSIYENGANVVGYIVWTLMDDWELFSGYTATYGLYSVDFASENRTRTPKSSVAWWQSVMETRELQPVPGASS